MKQILLLTSAILLLIGCSPQRYCQNRGYFQQVGNDTVIRDSVVIRETQIPVYIASDSGYLQAWIECVKSKPVITQITSYEAGNHVKPPMVSIEGNVLTAKCKIDSFAVFAAYREKNVYRQLKTSQTVVKVTNILTKGQSFWIITGKILFSVGLVALVLWVAWTIFKAKFGGFVTKLFDKLIR